MSHRMVGASVFVGISTFANLVRIDDGSVTPPPSRRVASIFG
jgi:hypothetical protein